MVAVLVITGWSWLWLILGIIVGIQLVELTEKLAKRLWRRQRE